MNVISVTRYGFSLAFSFLFIHQCDCDLNFCLSDNSNSFDLTIKNPWPEKTKRGIIYGVQWGILKYRNKFIDLITGFGTYRYKFDKRAYFFNSWGLWLKKITPQDSGKYFGFMLSNGNIYNYSIQVYIIDISKLLHQELKIKPIYSGGSVHQLACGQDLQSGPVSLIQLKNVNDSSQKIKSFIQHDGLWFFRFPKNKRLDEYSCEINTTSLCDICQICTNTTSSTTTTATKPAKWKLTVTLIVVSCIGALYILATIWALMVCYFSKYKKRKNKTPERDEIPSAETKPIKSKSIMSRVVRTSEKDESEFLEISKKSEEEEQAEINKSRKEYPVISAKYFKQKYPSLEKDGSQRSDTSKGVSSSNQGSRVSGGRAKKNWDKIKTKIMSKSFPFCP